MWEPDPFYGQNMGSFKLEITNFLPICDKNGLNFWTSPSVG